MFQSGDRVTNMKTRQTGFTLIELMIVVVVIATLAAIAYPSYLSQVRKGHRASMQGKLQEVTLRLEQWKAQHFSYPTQANFTTATGVTTTQDHYTLSYVPDTTDYQSYTITATPNSGDQQERDGTLMLDSIGQTCFVEGATTCDLTDPSQSWSK